MTTSPPPAAAVLDPAQETEEAVDQIRPHLAGRSPDVQSAILADLLAYWLAGHFVDGDTDATREVRRKLLEVHLDLVHTLTSINAAALGTPT